MFKKSLQSQTKQTSITDVISCIVLNFIVYFIMEILSHQSIGGTFLYLWNHPIAFLYNVSILFLPVTFVFFLRRRIFSVIMISILWTLFGVANFAISSNRVTPFTYQDFDLLVNELYLITAYLSPLEIVGIILGLVLLVVGLVLLFIKGPKYTPKIHYGKVAIACVSYLVAFCLFSVLAIQTGALQTVFPNITTAYHENGLPYSFFANALNRGIKKPLSYSENKIAALLAGKPEADKMSEKPNVIMLQLESFFDPEYVKDWELSEDAIPNFRQLKEDFSSGFLTVPGFGMGTVNTEFEVMTGMSVNFFGTGEYPYKTYLKSNQVESMAYNLLELGYATHALHNNDATFYNRHKRFKNLGFETFTPIEFMNSEETTPNGWAKDGVLIDEIAKNLDSSEQSDYIYAISVQGHGVYPTEQIDDSQKITLTCSESDEKRHGYEYFVNQINEMDQFVADLIDYLESREDKTILVLYGDHLPTFEFQASELENNNIYQTEYIIWDNIGLEKNDQDLSAYQLPAVVSDKIGLHSGTTSYYHQQNMNQGNDKTYLKNLKMLQYDMLYGKQYAYAGKFPYSKISTQYDVEEIAITDITKTGESLIIKGKHFTPFSKILINDDLYEETEYIDSNTLKISDAEIATGDKVYVEQFGKNEKSHLWKTEASIYQE